MAYDDSDPSGLAGQDESLAPVAVKILVAGAFGLIASIIGVMTVPPERIVARVKWADVEASAGDLMLDAGTFPARFYVSTFPSVALFDSMPKHEA